MICLSKCPVDGCNWLSRGWPTREKSHAETFWHMHERHPDAYPEPPDVADPRPEKAVTSDA